jgi:phosphatidate cytidylyltransferase
LLAQRVATAAVGIPLLCGLIWLGGPAYETAAILILVVAAAEFAHLRYPWLHVYTALACTGVAGLVLAAATDQPAVLVVPIAAVGMCVLAAIEPLARGHVRPRTIDPMPALTVAGAVLYAGVLGSTIVLLREHADGRDWVFLALFSTFAVDTAAYFTGRAIGRHRMAPEISPKKTWEGFAGGYAGGIAAVIILNYALGLRTGTGAIAVIAIALPAAAAAGDLVESWLKRRSGVKDASELIPGHGGLLDRLDSVLFTFPLVYSVARWIP